MKFDTVQMPSKVVPGQDLFLQAHLQEVFKLPLYLQVMKGQQATPIEAAWK